MQVNALIFNKAHAKRKDVFGSFLQKSVLLLVTTGAGPGLLASSGPGPGLLVTTGPGPGLLTDYDSWKRRV